MSTKQQARMSRPRILAAMAALALPPLAAQAQIVNWHIESQISELVAYYPTSPEPLDHIGAMRVGQTLVSDIVVDLGRDTVLSGTAGTTDARLSYAITPAQLPMAGIWQANLSTPYPLFFTDVSIVTTPAQVAQSKGVPLLDSPVQPARLWLELAVRGAGAVEGGYTLSDLNQILASGDKDRLELWMVLFGVTNLNIADADFAGAGMRIQSVSVSAVPEVSSGAAMGLGVGALSVAATWTRRRTHGPRPHSSI